MKDIFHQSPNVTPKKHNLYIHAQNTTNFGNKSLRAFDANIWSTLLEYIKSTKMQMQDQNGNASYTNKNEIFS